MGTNIEKALKNLENNKYIDDEELEKIKKVIYLSQLKRYAKDLEILSKCEEVMESRIDDMEDKELVIAYRNIIQGMQGIEKSVRQFFPSMQEKFSINLKDYGITEGEEAGTALRKILAFNLGNLLEITAMTADEIKKYKLGSLEHWKLLETSKATNDRILDLARTINKLGDDDDENKTLGIGEILDMYTKAKSNKKGLKLEKQEELGAIEEKS